MGKLRDHIKVVIAKFDTPSGQMNNPGWLGWTDRPGDVQLLAQKRVRTIGMKSAGNRRACTKTIALMVKSARAAAGIGVGFEHRDIMPCLCAATVNSPDDCADDDELW